MSVQQVDEDEDHDQQQQAGLDDGVVAVADGGEHQRAEAGPGEDRLDDDGAAEQSAELEADRGHHRDQGVA